MTPTANAATQAFLSNLVLDNIPAVKTVRWDDYGDNLVAHLGLRWYAGLSLGVLHSRTLKQAHELLDAHKPEGMVILVSVFG